MKKGISIIHADSGFVLESQYLSGRAGINAAMKVEDACFG